MVRISLLRILLVIPFAGMPSFVAAQQPQTYKSADGRLHAKIAPVSRSCPEHLLVIFGRNGALLYRKDFSSSDCEHGDVIVRGEWSPDSEFFVLNVESIGGHKTGHSPVLFYSRHENKLYRLENYVGFIVAQDFTLEAPHIVRSEKQTSVGELEGVPIKVDLLRINGRSRPTPRFSRRPTITHKPKGATQRWKEVRSGGSASSGRWGSVPLFLSVKIRCN